MNELMAPTSSSLYGPDGCFSLLSGGEELDYKSRVIPSSMSYSSSINALISVCGKPNKFLAYLGCKLLISMLIYSVSDG